MRIGTIEGKGKSGEGEEDLRGKEIGKSEVVIGKSELKTGKSKVGRD